MATIQLGYLSVTFGRKKTQIYNNLVALVGAALVCTSRAAQSFEMIMLGRLVYGINAGVSLNLHPMYIGECAPQSKRGMVTVSVSFSVVLGKLMGFVIGLREFLGREELWPLLLACSAVPALIQLVTLPFFPESPRYLLIDKGDKEGCLKAMQQLWGPGEHCAEMGNMFKEKEAVGEQTKGLKDLLVDRAVRWQMISLLLICGAMQLVGINAVYFYAYDIFQNAGISAIEAPYVSLGLGITEIFTTILCGFLIDRQGRKTLLWLNYVILASTLTLLTVTLTLQEALGTFCFIFFLVFCICVAIYSFWVLPETKDRSMMEIMESFNKLNFGAKNEDKLVCTRL
ncbi:hypothetical protein GDO81_002195 [Engystomops pustulosus]|uniref:Major facilitator superfamily (MFS) profile domain-containing protein n=1 Tax=Engystomops pustulosus TaxID=76066 RepID=A0AAV7DI77_ENGPU|nr:hypothetical protein GDO81_002195 [Engystomops pustulosus]